MHHKRLRPKSRRAGSLVCKPFKANHAKVTERDRASDRRRQDAAASQGGA